MTTRRADGVATIVRDLWTSRELIDQLVRRDVRLRYRQAVMGFAWALLMPALTIAAGLVIKGALARGGGETPSLAGIALKSWAWAFFAGAMNFATMSLLSNISLVTKIWFPEVLRSAPCWRSVSTFLRGPGHPRPDRAAARHDLGWSILWLPVLLLLLLSFTTGLAFLFACANIFFRDVKYILQVLLTFGIFFTPVLMEPSQMGRYAELVMMNPLSPILEGLRLAVTAGHNLLTPLDINGAVAWRPWWLGYSGDLVGHAAWAGLALLPRQCRAFAEAY
ncbi:MAG: ABC transporter permease [Gemmatimonadetes bacterium]|nr:ABC transporter permease [Gemmatimonadota bacterium]